MPGFQKTFRYEADTSRAAVTDLIIEFNIPRYEYAASITDGKPAIERESAGDERLSVIQKIQDKEYSISFPGELLSGDSDISLLNFWKLSLQTATTVNDPSVLDPFSAAASFSVSDLQGNLIVADHMDFLYSFASTSDELKQAVAAWKELYSDKTTAPGEDAVNAVEQKIIHAIRDSIFIVSRIAFDDLALQIKELLPKYNSYALLRMIAACTNPAGEIPVFQYNADDFSRFMKTELRVERVPPALVKLLKHSFGGLFDFPVAVPEIQVMDIKGVLTVINLESKSDLNFYSITAEYSCTVPGAVGVPCMQSFDWASLPAGEPAGNKVHFSFPPVVSNRISSPVLVSLRQYDGTIAWEKSYAASDPVLQQLAIEVTLLKPGLSTAAPNPAPAGPGKKLNGKVIELSGLCQMKGITVVVQGKKENAATWTILGTSVTDASGNFSLPYPYGNYAAAQAIVSLTPDSPADISMDTNDADHALNEYISDDFLYLLVKNANCTPPEKGEDCNCADPNSSNRLPNQQDLISSDSYTQDIGGSCVNLSTPNRTLGEYMHTAIVRTSDPDVANYVISRDPKGTSFRLFGGEIRVMRKPVGLNNPIRWHDAPGDHNNLSVSQAVSVATGHILHYSVVTKADGYSIGELLYSLALAPGQKKEIVTFDQTHTLTGTERQRLSQAESLAASLVNDVNITDTIAGNIGQDESGSSSANTSGVSGGLGLAGLFQGIGVSLGVAGGTANSNSSASQSSSRELAEFFNEKMKNSITQNSQSYREMNASVVTTVQEGQHYGVTSEVVANHNHCHSLTMMYFEVLRHYAIYQDLDYVEECLFIPFLMTDFTMDNIYKWRDVLAQNLLPVPAETYLQPFVLIKSGRQHPLLKAFDAVERKKTFYQNVDYPTGAYDDEVISFITGEIYIHTNLPRPKSKYDRIKSWPIQKTDTWSWSGALVGGIFGGLLGAIAGGYLNSDGTLNAEASSLINQYISVDANFASVPPAQCIRVKKVDDHFFEDSGFDKAQWVAYAALTGQDVFGMLSYYFKDRLISEWDSIYNNDIAPVIFDRICENIGLENETIVSPGTPVKFSALDFAAENRYKGGDTIVKINLRGSGSSLKRNQVLNLKLLFDNSAHLSNDLVTLFVRNLSIRYSTPHYNGTLYSGYIGDDLIDNTPIYAPENANEKRNPRKEDDYMVAKLIEHLNSNMEYYNKVLWRNLDPDRRYMLIDGFNIETYDDFGQPNGLRSLASVVKNELIGIAGNSLIMAVAPGYKIDRTFITEQPIEGPAVTVSLLDHYKPLTPIPPYRVSIPSRGVFAEAVQGACNACEKQVENTSQDWDKFKTDEPTAINPVTTPTPTVTDWKAAFKDFATPMINIQNAPAAPAPGAGLAAAGVSDLLGKANLFKDITGLDQNQKNAMQTYLSDQQNAKDFAQMAKDIFTQGHNTDHADKIADSIRNSPELSAADKAQLLKDHFGQMVDGGQTKKADQATAAQAGKPSLTNAAVKAADSGKAVKATSADGSGNVETVDISGGEGGAGSANVLAEAPQPYFPTKQTATELCWATAAAFMMSWKNKAAVDIQGMLQGIGAYYLDKYNTNKPLYTSEKPDFISKLGMVSEPPASYIVQKYIDWVNTYGPVWITTDSNQATGQFSAHAKVLVKITGTGSDDGIGTDFTFYDPITGTILPPQPFNDFIKEYEQLVTDNPGDLFVQIVHFAAAGTAATGPDALPAGPFGTLTVTDTNRAFTYPFTSDDLLWMARMVTGEAGGQDTPDNRAVIWAMFNKYALVRHNSYASFQQFIRNYSTVLQPVLNSWGAAKRHMNDANFVKTGGFYPGHEAASADPVPKGQLQNHLDLQATKWKDLPAAARNVVESAMMGNIPNNIGNASEFDNTRTYYHDQNAAWPTHDQWVTFTNNFATSNYSGTWIGDVAGLNQETVNAFFITGGDSGLAPDSVTVTAPAAPGEGSASTDLINYSPASDSTIVVNRVEFKAVTGLSNWKKAGVEHNTHANGVRNASNLIHLVLHETDSPITSEATTHGFDGTSGNTSHMAVLRDGTALQFNDLLQVEFHTIGLNTSGIGIEFANRGWLASPKPAGPHQDDPDTAANHLQWEHEAIPASVGNMQADQLAKFPEGNDFLYCFWGFGFGIYRIPPDTTQLEKEVDLVNWITSGLSDTLSHLTDQLNFTAASERASLIRNNINPDLTDATVNLIIANSGVTGTGAGLKSMFFAIEKTWLQLVSYNDVTALWNFPAANVPADNEQDTKNLFVFTTGFGFLEPANIAGKSGIVSHNSVFENHSDGSFLTLYTWLRIEKQFDSTKSYRLAKSLMKDHFFKASLRTNPDDKKIVILNVADANLV